MKQTRFLGKAILTGLCAVLLCLAQQGVGRAENPFSTPLTDCSVNAQNMVRELDTQPPSADLLDAFNNLYRAGDPQGAYVYYLMHQDRFQSSCWMLNNVGLALLQLGKNREALTLFMAIQFRNPKGQPESLLNMLIAGYALRIDPIELLEEVKMTPDAIRECLTSKEYSASEINSLIDALCYNIIYMRMESPYLTAMPSQTVRTQNLTVLLKKETKGNIILSMLRNMSRQDEDARKLLAYAEALMTLREGTAVP